VEGSQRFEAAGAFTYTDVDVYDQLILSFELLDSEWLGVAGERLTLELDAQTNFETIFSIVQNSANSAKTAGWAFNPADESLDFLASKDSLDLNYLVFVSDGKGGEASQEVSITITGTNDAPLISAIDATALTEKTDSDALTTTIPVTFTDVDLTDIGHTASITGVVATGTTTGLALNQDALRALVSLGSVTKDSGSSSGLLNMNFSAPATALDYLAEDEVLTLRYTVEVNDGDGGVTSKTFEVNITGTDDLPIVQDSSVTALPITGFEYQFSAQDFKFIDPDSVLQAIRITELPIVPPNT
jgi:VCBS repeat-containing protein